MSEARRCPSCGALADFSRSRPRGLLEKGLARLAGLDTYRCGACLSRVYRWGWPEHSKAERGFLVFGNGSDDLQIRAARNVEHETIAERLREALDADDLVPHPLARGAREAHHA